MPNNNAKNEIPQTTIDASIIDNERNVEALYKSWISNTTLPYSAHHLTNKLVKLLGTDAVLEHELMSKHTTFKVGGAADVMVLPHTKEEIANVITLCNENDVQFKVMGRGSNILVSDAGVSCVVIKLAENFSHIKVDADNAENIYAQAGASNKDVAQVAFENSLTGFEFASGIPGSVGGGAVMNAGAYDGEFSHICTSVECITPQGKFVTLSANDACWGYRKSFMMDNNYIVIGVTLHLKKGDSANIKATMDDLQNRREEKQPLDMPSAGSTFKRPEGFYAAALIQEAGMQGHTRGGACVSKKHAGFVVNAAHATATDICNVIEDVQHAVYEKSGVTLEPEVRMWGF